MPWNWATGRVIANLAAINSYHGLRLSRWTGSVCGFDHQPGVALLEPTWIAVALPAWRSAASCKAISSSGYVVHTLEAALWAVARSTSFREAILTAANLGHDADTVAAIAGQPAGALPVPTGCIVSARQGA
jgi:hypothetical protein